MQSKKYDFVIVGSGAGGGTLARELSRRGKKVLVVAERGRHEKQLGTFMKSMRFFDLAGPLKMPPKSKEGIILWRAIMLGGTTVIAAGNAMRCLEEELAGFGITLNEEFSEAERELKIAPIADGLLSEGSRRILEASKELGYKMEPMPKAVDPMKCARCGNCTYGCVNGAKWTALNYLEEAMQNGVDILCETKITKVVVENGRAKGVKGKGPGGPVDIKADVVILAAGGLGTPVILQQSGFKDAGEGLFLDLFVDTFGVTEGVNQLDEPMMSLIDCEFYSKGFTLNANIIANRMIRFMTAGNKGFILPAQRLIGILTMIADEPVGRVYPDGKVSKPITERDKARLQEGTSIAKEILVKAGADSKSMVISNPQGGHPGGTSAIGRVVDKDLQTEVNNLFVCDESVFPVPSGGKPPILTIVALAKRLAKTLVS